MLEIEAKLFFPNGSARKIGRALTLAGISLGPSVRQQDRVFAASRDAILNPAEGTVISRVRTTDQGVSLTVKVRQDRDLSRSEAEVGVDNPEAAEAVLTALGQQHVVTVNKLRASGRLGGATVTVDDVVGLGTFIEVEILTDDTGARSTNELAAVVQKIEQHIGIAGERVEKGYDKLLLESYDAAPVDQDPSAAT